MQPRIVVLDTGEVYSINDPELEFLIGRDEKAQLRLNDPSVSRRHCVIQRLCLYECGSLNGTRLNGKPVLETEPLKHRDRIDVGEKALVLLTEEDRPVIQEDASPAGAPRPTVLANTNVLLENLLQGTRALSKLRDTVSIQRQIFSFLFSFTPADRAALSLDGTWTFRDRGGDESPFPVDREAPGTILCIPIESGVRGLMYAEVCEPDGIFNTGHQELILGMVGTAGLALEYASVIEQLEAQKSRMQQDLDLRHEMAGDSPAMAALAAQIAQVAPVATTVLIQGETGTGKELIARAIHRNSKRADKPFVAFNCGAMPENLIDSELFGHERGAFTGAVQQKKGLFEEASGGTLFMDEIGDLPLELQVKLLRALQEREVRRLGGTRTIPVDVRVICATHRDLRKEVREGRFREDLYYRLNVVPIKTPPLRERREDIPLLARHLVRKIAKKLGRVIEGISKEAEELLMQHSWPGNVRELENVIERAIVLGAGRLIMPEDLPPDLLEGLTPPVPMPFAEAVNGFKRELIERALRENNGDAAAAAAQLGLSRPQLYALIKKFNLKP